MVLNCLIDEFLPMGDGCEAIPNLKGAIQAIASALCSGCARQVPDETPTEDFIAVGWGSVAEIPGQCDSLLVQRENGQTYISFDEGTTWRLIFNPTSSINNARIRNGLHVEVDNTNLVRVGVGEMIVRGLRVEKTIMTSLNVSVNADWVSGTASDTASTKIGVYMNEAGDIKLHNALPNYSNFDLTNRVFEALVNQPTWNGTAALGLNAGSLIYDGDTGEASLKAGMLLGIFSQTDVNYSEGRGRGSGAAGSKNNASWVVISAINTGTNTITIGTANHNIAINNNDRLIAIQPGELMYRYEGTTWWRLIDVIENDSSSNLIPSRRQNYAETALIGGAANISTTSTSFVTITGATLPLFCRGEPVKLNFTGTISAASIFVFLDYEVDGIRRGSVATGTDGLIFLQNVNGDASFSSLIRDLPPGTHTFSLVWKVSAGTGTLHSGFGSQVMSNQFWLEESRYD